MMFLMEDISMIELSSIREIAFRVPSQMILSRVRPMRTTDRQFLRRSATKSVGKVRAGSHYSPADHCQQNRKHELSRQTRDPMTNASGWARSHLNLNNTSRSQRCLGSYSEEEGEPVKAKRRTPVCVAGATFALGRARVAFAVHDGHGAATAGTSHKA